MTRIPFVAVAHRQNENVDDNNHGNSISFESSFCSAANEQGSEEDITQRLDRYEQYVSHKLKNVNLDSRSTMFSSQVGKWFIKGYGGFIYIVCTSFDYPDDIAVECLDELCEAHRAMSTTASRRFWNATQRLRSLHPRQQRRQQAKQQSCCCCEVVASKYGAMEDEDSAPHVLAKAVDPDVRDRYFRSLRKVQEEVDRLTKQMDDNLHDLIARGENIARLDELSQDLLEQTLIFKKQARKVRWLDRIKNKKALLVGTGFAAVAGATAGFMAGGPGGAALLTGVSSVAAAEAIEAGVGALVFSTSYLGLHATQESWFSSLQFIPVFSM